MKTNENILLVEGKDDLNVTAHLLRRRLGIEKIEEIVNIQDEESVDKLLINCQYSIFNIQLSMKGWTARVIHCYR